MKKHSELLREIASYAVILAALYLFYKSWIALILFPPLAFACRKINRKDRERRRREKAANKFRDFLASMSAALRAGYSVENAIGEAYQEMVNIYGLEDDICTEIKRMMNELSLGENAEDVFDSFAEKMQVEDIYTFASVFRIAKRSGGNLVEIISKTASDIAAKVDTQNEISVIISSKRLEQTIMSLMPLAMIVFIDLTSGGMLDPLYRNPFGVCVMTVCLALYAASWLLSRKIINIKV